MESPPYFASLEPTCRRSVMSQPHILCQRYDPPLSSYPLDNTMEHVHGLPGATSKVVWGGKDLEGVKEEFDEDKDIRPFVMIDEETIQHFSHDHHLRLQGNSNSCDHENKFCQACCLELIASESFYGCMQCDFVLHEACASLPRRKHHPLHKHQLTLHPFPLKPEFEAYVKGMFACDGCDQLNCGFLYKCGEKGCGFQLDVRCASLSNPFTHANYHELDHPLFFSKTRGICMGCKSSKCSRYLLECRTCNFVVGLKCATLPCVARYKHDRHPLALCYGKEGQSSCSMFVGKRYLYEATPYH
ncbi:unnamed protein product [Microthlaspi erraticum]|uniref:DC1 domain-containing protein n=1 Tax=Microthlaspi erraticum TaxID=1685480 RepID=A0A6D2IGB6_9BRAS|nr:unnamed protein product [Microthlaspi erraticum]